MPELERPSEKEIAFLVELEKREDHQAEMKEGAEGKPLFIGLEKRGYVRMVDAFTMPFKVPTGTKIIILTEAGLIALHFVKREASLSQC